MEEASEERLPLQTRAAWHGLLIWEAKDMPYVGHLLELIGPLEGTLAHQKLCTDTAGCKHIDLWSILSLPQQQLWRPVRYTVAVTWQSIVSKTAVHDGRSETLSTSMFIKQKQSLKGVVGGELRAQ